MGTTLGEYRLRNDGSNGVLEFDEYNPGKQSDWQRCDRIIADLKRELKVMLTVSEIADLKQAVESALHYSQSRQTEKVAEKVEEMRLKFVNSTCWRITAPIRIIGQMFRSRR